MDKLWSKRFSKSNSVLMEEFNASIFFDRFLYEEDIAGSKAHAKMLRKIGILNFKELQSILTGLEVVRQKILNDEITFAAREEDIHTKIEQELGKEIGSLAGKLHTARSRNDQVNSDLRLFIRFHLRQHQQQLISLLEEILKLSRKNQQVILPGFTHLQAAQPMTLSFYFLGYFFMLERDFERLQDSFKRINLSSLGSGALAGVNYAVDRKMVQRELGFDDILPNALDAVSDRDFVLEYVGVLSILMMHLSRMSEELIFFSSQSMKFIEIDEAYATGSSIMPNKKNPDALELIRGKTGRVYGNLISLLTVMKGLPLAYNKDLQEDKEGLMDSITTVSLCLRVLVEILKTLKFYPENMLKQCERGYLQATDIADYLVNKGMPFRKAHEVSAGLVNQLSAQGKLYSDLTLNDFQKHSILFESDIFSAIEMKKVVENKKSEGSTSFLSVKNQIRLASQKLKRAKSLIKKKRI